MDWPIKKCPDCGAQIPGDAPAGLCIACVLMMAQHGSDPAKNAPAQTSKALLREVGDYELIREIGRGGMGVVYEARQKKLDRLVALKLILAGEFASETAVARFQEEAELLASLAHPSIVPIYEIGEHQGCHFYSMKLIVGESVAARLSPLSSSARSSRDNEAMAVLPADRPESKQSLVTSAATPRGDGFTPRESASLMATVAHAVHFAHQCGIIHRDLSPENILLNAEGEPCVTDFGMARLVGRDRRLTQTNAILGKPDYMAPEQSDP
ncbi:MAG: serine/threonine-protein kinase, partial [Verrucomicrobiota bacterium]